MQAISARFNGVNTQAVLANLQSQAFLKSLGSSSLPCRNKMPFVNVGYPFKMDDQRNVNVSKRL